MITSLGLLVRKAELSFNEFTSYYQEDHAALGTHLPDLAHYTTGSPVEPDLGIKRREAGEIATPSKDEMVLQFDGLSEECFEDFEALRTAFDTNAGEEILQDETQFMEGVYYLIAEHSTHVE